MYLLLLALLGGGQVPPSAPPPPPPIPTFVMTTGMEGQLSLQWIETGPDLDTVQRYTYRLYLEGQKKGEVLQKVACDGPLVGQVPPKLMQYNCRVQQVPPIVKKPGLYRIYLTAAYSSDSKESLPSATAPYNVRNPPPTPIGGVIVK